MLMSDLTHRSLACEAHLNMAIENELYKSLPLPSNLVHAFHQDRSVRGLNKLDIYATFCLGKTLQSISMLSSTLSLTTLREITYTATFPCVLSSQINPSTSISTEDKKLLNSCSGLPSLQLYYSHFTRSTISPINGACSFGSHRRYRGRRSEMKANLRESRKSFNIQSIITPFRENRRKFASTASSRTVNNIISIPHFSAFNL